MKPSLLRLATVAAVAVAPLASAGRQQQQRPQRPPPRRRTTQTQAGYRPAVSGRSPTPQREQQRQRRQKQRPRRLGKSKGGKENKNNATQMSTKYTTEMSTPETTETTDAAVLIREDGDSSSSSSSSTSSGKASKKSPSQSQGSSAAEEMIDFTLQQREEDSTTGVAASSGSSSSSSSKAEKASSSSASATGITDGTTSKLVDPSAFVCNSGERCPEIGSECARGTETCFGRTYHSFVCDCVSLGADDGGLEYVCGFTDACLEAAIAADDYDSTAPDRDGHSSDGGKSGKSSKSSKSAKASKLAKSQHHHEVGVHDPMASVYGKSSKSAKSAKSAKSSKSTKSSKGYYYVAPEPVVAERVTTKSPTTTSPITSSPTTGSPVSQTPTMMPTDGILRTFAAPLAGDQADPCSGDPCPFSSWCRSNEGACGPGFTYCNDRSTWTGDCAPTGTPTTDSPTHGPTASTRPSAKPTMPSAALRDASSNFANAVDWDGLESKGAASAEATTASDAVVVEEKVGPMTTRVEEDPPVSDGRGWIVGTIVALTVLGLAGAGAVWKWGGTLDDYLERVQLHRNAADVV